MFRYTLGTALPSLPILDLCLQVRLHTLPWHHLYLTGQVYSTHPYVHAKRKTKEYYICGYNLALHCRKTCFERT